ncbi:MAG TPA: MBL fold metallo-hydrolase [Polyangiaceae bacterium]
MSTSRTSGAVREVASGVFAYLQEGGWGFSNAGLIADSGASLLVDTLYDIGLTRCMLDELRRVTPAADHIGTLVNTHANGDHCWGNALIENAKIISSRAAAAEMAELSPRVMAGLVSGARLVARAGRGTAGLRRLLGRLGIPADVWGTADFVVDNFGAFDFRGIAFKPPTDTFEGRLHLEVGSKCVELIEVGPAHTKGDVVVFLPKERVAFTGDILFIGSHPIMWEGPVENWIRACDRLLDLDVDVFVPGHGPVTTKEGVRRTKEYWEMLLEVSRAGCAAGASSDEIATELHARGFDEWTEGSRVAVNVDTICRELRGDRSRRYPLAMLAKMARLERHHAPPEAPTRDD